jgi:hypothetical protein
VTAGKIDKLARSPNSIGNFYADGLNATAARAVEALKQAAWAP